MVKTKHEKKTPHKSEFIPVYNCAPDPLHFRWPTAKGILLNSINRFE